MIECYFMCQSNNGSIGNTHALRRWSNKYMQSITGIKDPRAPLQLQNLFAAAGLVDIEYRMIQLPLCGWSAGTQAFSFPSRTMNFDSIAEKLIAMEI